MEKHDESFGDNSSLAGVVTWIVHGPFHPLWSWWMISVASLRDIPGVPPANKHYPEAEYEFLILSLNPEPEPPRPSIPDIDGMEETGDAERCLPGFLTPADAVIQFHGVSTEDAAVVADYAARAIVIGRMSPDSDFRSSWERAIPQTVEHLRNNAEGRPPHAHIR